MAGRLLLQSSRNLAMFPHFIAGCLFDLDRNKGSCVCVRFVSSNHQSHYCAGVHLWRLAAVFVWSYSC